MSPWNKKKRLWVDKWPICSHVLNTTEVVTLDSHYRMGSMYADLSTNVVTQENGVFVEIEISWKIHPQGSDESRCSLFCFSSPEGRMNSWATWYWTCFQFIGFDSSSHSSSKQGYPGGLGWHQCGGKRNSAARDD